MGILGRFNRRKERDRIRLKHHKYPAKHRITTRMQSILSQPTPSVSYSKTQSHYPQTVSSKHAPNNTNNQIININAATAILIRNEVTDLLNSSSDQSCTTLEMASALAQSQACLESHSKIDEKQYGFFAKTFMRKLRQEKPGTIDRADKMKTQSSRTKHKGRLPLEYLGRTGVFSSKLEKESMRSRYQWVDALNRLEKCPSSRDQVISTWEEAKKHLDVIFSFPSVHLLSEESNYENGSGLVENELGKNIETEIAIVQENVNALSVSNVKWKQILSYPSERGLNDERNGALITEDAEDLEVLVQKESIDKADLYFNARIRTAEELANVLRERDSVKKLEERRLLNEARKRASQLMRTLDVDERKIVETAIHGYGPGDEVVAQAGTDSVQRASMKTLKPGMWLNDEIIHYFYLMLAKRDEELCGNDSSRKRSHFFKSFFITKLLNEGNATCDGKYEYRNVKRWSKKVPGKDIFNLDKILFPINMGNMHWICAAIFMNKKRIEIFDSMGSNGDRYLNALFNYIQDEHADKKKTPLPDADSWELVPTQPDTPRQTNGHDCGVFTCMFADFLSKDTDLVFSQDHIDQCRERIALSIMKGKAIM
mmetsp:Transcript_24512/g.57602  ORF Transcript_24512/g.57602 Transcript_24512/m.57602 type:complete len:599 (+) Transcript_24512:101-1897(+)|eukprot:CAMPEP_0197187440 /NCGR_PEP_ID=MMETSP1423-20130617/15833_1 /TAXON_ID=476441 /ORGANISM="Pseudo-nitzschia heimii, Strain UNC1101" /LENGTH=598 /DNA_ID=CAMNT_0042639007 /DNA_START=67 /DNA_END=1863 /DNA_ORIENTATION=+